MSVEEKWSQVWPCYIRLSV